MIESCEHCDQRIRPDDRVVQAMGPDGGVVFVLEAHWTVNNVGGWSEMKRGKLTDFRPTAE